jgi:hypothetical protein
VPRGTHVWTLRILGLSEDPVGVTFFFSLQTNLLELYLSLAVLLNRGRMAAAGEAFDLERLQTAIVENSEADSWTQAKGEWELRTIYDDDGHCLCGHHIVEHCVIYNSRTKRELVVGNVCINHFDEDALFVPLPARASLRRIQADMEAKANADLLELALRLHIISKKEHDHYRDITTGTGSRNRFNDDHYEFDQDAYDFREKINRFLEMGFTNTRPRCHCHQLARPRQSNKNPEIAFYGCADYPHGCDFRSFPNKKET